MITTGQLTTAKSDRSTNLVEQIKCDLRFTDWALSKIPMVCTVGAALCLSEQQTSWQNVWNLLIFCFLFAPASAAFGFLINDLGDRELDALHRKRNTFTDLGNKKAAWVVIATAVLMLAATIPFWNRWEFLGLFFLWLLVTTAYSLPPLRMKERGAAGVAASTIAQSLLPIFIASTALTANGVTLWLLIPLALCSTVCGATLELAHQRYDRQRDSSTNTPTWAVRLGITKFDRLYKFSLTMDRFAVGAVLTVLSVLAFAGGNLIGMVSIAVVFGLYLSSFVAVSLRDKNTFVDPYYGNRTLADRLLHDLIPNLLIPAHALLCLVLLSPHWLVPFGCFVAWRVLIPRLQ
jgi:4-hydroxybenzoate polyprenyltransferase and related prenyltransferases